MVLTLSIGQSLAVRLRRHRTVLSPKCWVRTARHASDVLQSWMILCYTLEPILEKLPLLFFFFIPNWTYCTEDPWYRRNNEAPSWQRQSVPILSGDILGVWKALSTKKEKARTWHIVLLIGKQNTACMFAYCRAPAHTAVEEDLQPLMFAEICAGSSVWSKTSRQQV